MGDALLDLNIVEPGDAAAAQREEDATAQRERAAAAAAAPSERGRVNVPGPVRPRPSADAFQSMALGALHRMQQRQQQQRGDAPSLAAANYESAPMALYPRRDVFYDPAEQPDQSSEAGDSSVAAARLLSGDLMRFLTLVCGSAGVTVARAVKAKTRVPSDTTEESVKSQVAILKESMVAQLGNVIDREVRVVEAAVMTAAAAAAGAIDPAAAPILVPEYEYVEHAMLLLACITSNDPRGIRSAYDKLQIYYDPYDGGVPLLRSFDDPASDVRDHTAAAIQLMHVAVCLPPLGPHSVQQADPEFEAIRGNVMKLIQKDNEMRTTTTKSVRGMNELELLDESFVAAIEEAYSLVAETPAAVVLGREGLMRSPHTRGDFASLCGKVLLMNRNVLAQKEYTPAIVGPALQTTISKLVNKFKYIISLH